MEIENENTCQSMFQRIIGAWEITETNIFSNKHKKFDHCKVF